MFYGGGRAVWYCREIAAYDTLQQNPAIPGCFLFVVPEVCNRGLPPYLIGYPHRFVAAFPLPRRFPAVPLSVRHCRTPKRCAAAIPLRHCRHPELVSGSVVIRNLNI